MDGFYYKGLSREEKSAYEQMLAGFKSLAPTIPGPCGERASWKRKLPFTISYWTAFAMIS